MSLTLEDFYAMIAQLAAKEADPKRRATYLSMLDAYAEIKAGTITPDKIREYTRRMLLD